jgi:uncharacterized protein (TIGR02246 family)
MVVQILALLSAAAAQCPPSTDAELAQVFERWVKAYERKDLTETMAIFAPEVRFQFQGTADQGWKDLESQYVRAFAMPSASNWTPKWNQIVVSDGVAAAFATWFGSKKDSEGKWQVVAENVSVDVLQRGSDCKWRIIRSLTYPKLPKAAK